MTSFNCGRTPDAARAIPRTSARNLAKLADQYGNAYPRKVGERHRAILLFEKLDHLRGSNPGNVWVTYEWWPDGHADCGADPDFHR